MAMNTRLRYALQVALGLLVAQLVFIATGFAIGCLCGL